MKNKLLNFILSEESNEERTVLHNWKNDASANLEGLKSLHDEKDGFEILRDYKEVNTKEAWHFVESQTSSQWTVFSGKLLNVAAILVVVVMALGGLYYMMNSQSVSSDNLMVYKGITSPEITYKDGSNIELDKNSNLKELNYRKFKLDGRAYFAVARDIEHPFTVETHFGTVEVLGTAFNVLTSVNSTNVFVKEGKVKVIYDNKELVLLPGDNLTVSKEGAFLNKNPLIQPDIWKESKITFKNQSFHSVMETIAIYYNIKLEWSENMQPSDNCRINTEFYKSDIESVLKELQILTQFQYKLSANKIVVYSYKC